MKIGITRWRGGSRIRRRQNRPNRRQNHPLNEAGQPKYGWKIFTYEWKGATAGEHTIVSRATEVTGEVQPTSEDLANKKTFLEDNSQHPRTVMIS